MVKKTKSESVKEKGEVGKEEEVQQSKAKEESLTVRTKMKNEKKLNSAIKKLNSKVSSKLDQK